MKLRDIFKRKDSKKGPSRDTPGAQASSSSGSTTTRNNERNKRFGFSKPGPTPTAKKVIPVVDKKIVLPKTVPFRISNTSKAMVGESTSVKRNIKQHARYVKTKHPPFNAPTHPNFRLGRDLMYYLVDYLDYPSIVFLSLTCKRLYDTVAVYHLQPTPQERLTILDAFHSSNVPKGERFPLHLCKECMMWHSFEHMVIWPNHKPESDFRTSYEYMYEQPRRCVRHAMRSGSWHPGQLIGDDHQLCSLCKKPHSNITGKCTWNCEYCNTCVGRDNWSSFCVKHTTPGSRTKLLELKDEDILAKDEPLGTGKEESEAKDDEHSTEEVKEEDKKISLEPQEPDGRDVMVCSSCSKFFFQVPGVTRKQLCNCGQAPFSTYVVNAPWTFSQPDDPSDAIKGEVEVMVDEGVAIAADDTISSPEKAKGEITDVVKMDEKFPVPGGWHADEDDLIDLQKEDEDIAVEGEKTDAPLKDSDGPVVLEDEFVKDKDKHEELGVATPDTSAEGIIDSHTEGKDKTAGSSGTDTWNISFLGIPIGNSEDDKTLSATEALEKDEQIKDSITESKDDNTPAEEDKVGKDEVTKKKSSAKDVLLKQPYDLGSSDLFTSWSWSDATNKETMAAPYYKKWDFSWASTDVSKKASGEAKTEKDEQKLKTEPAETKILSDLELIPGGPDGSVSKAADYLSDFTNSMLKKVNGEATTTQKNKPATDPRVKDNTTINEAKPKPRKSKLGLGSFAFDVDELENSTCDKCSGYLYSAPGRERTQLCRCHATGALDTSSSVDKGGSGLSEQTADKEKELIEEQESSKEHESSKQKETSKQKKPKTEKILTLKKKLDQEFTTSKDESKTQSNGKICHKCFRKTEASPSATLKEIAELCLCPDVPLSSTSSTTKSSDSTEKTEPSTDTSTTGTPNPQKGGTYFPEQPTPQPRAICLICHKFNTITPGVTLMDQMCRCPDGPLTLSGQDTAVTTDATTTQKRVSIFGDFLGKKTEPRTRPTCVKCLKFNTFTTGVTLMDEMCRCTDGPLPLRPGALKVRPPSPTRRPSIFGDLMAQRMQPKRRPRCVRCLKFSSFTTGITLLEEMCHCPNGPLDTNATPVSPKVPADGNNTPEPLDVDTTPTVTAVSPKDSRPRCAICKGYSSITTGVTLKEEMCQCTFGPLTPRPPRPQPFMNRASTPGTSTQNTSTTPQANARYSQPPPAVNSQSTTGRRERRRSKELDTLLASYDNLGKGGAGMKCGLCLGYIGEVDIMKRSEMCRCKDARWNDTRGGW